MSAAPLTTDDLRRYAVARSLFAPSSLGQAMQRLGFVQADPIRSPARAQDLILRHRVKGYRVGDLERHYPQLKLEEDFFINHGFMPARLHALMHPRQGYRTWPKSQWAQAHRLLDFVRSRGVVHPREVDAAMAMGGARNFFGGNSRASTQLMDGLLYRGLLRVARRESGIRLFEARPPWPDVRDPAAAYDELVDVVVAQYAPVPRPTLSMLLGRLLYGAPQWKPLRASALARAKKRLSHAVVDGIDWYWPAGEDPRSPRYVQEQGVHLLAPFDPVVWDRHRFERFWGWPYRFEAYVPQPKRERGYYAMPLLWRGQVIGWGNLSVRADGQGLPSLQGSFGYVDARAACGSDFRQALDEEMHRIQAFLCLGGK
jgi:uncharacterized protein YcaQ